MRQTYIEFYYPGAFVADTSVRAVDAKLRHHPEQVVDLFAYGFRFFVKEEVDVEGVHCESSPMNYSGMYYLGGKELSLADVEAMPESERGCLLDNMRTNGWKRVVKTRQGWYQPLEQGDTILR